MNFRLFLLDVKFFKLFKEGEFNTKTKKNRPYLIIEEHNNKEFNDCLCIIPLSSEKEDNKFKIRAEEHPDFYHKIEVEQTFDSYLILQSLFYVKKEFIGKAYRVNDEQFCLTDSEERKIVMRKLKKVNKLRKRSVLGYVKIEFVAWEKVLERQLEFFEKRARK